MGEIELVEGNLLEADVEALVNTVNTVGVMGKGIALQFRKTFPGNYKAYRKACEAGEVVPGKMFVFDMGGIENPRLIVNFPTKRHWKGKTRIEDIEEGLVDLVRVLRVWDVHSVAVPPLGCGNGGLEWSRVRPVIERALEPVPDLAVKLYEPAGAPAPEEQKIATTRPNMTAGRAALLSALDTYAIEPGVSMTMLVVQKIAYLLQVTGQPLRLEFVKGTYGPYSETLNHVLQRIEGHFITGYGDRSSPAQIQLVREAVKEGWEFIGDDRGTKDRIDRVYRLIDGFDSPFGLELLTTVHWAVEQEGSKSPEEALQVVASWTKRKKEAFPARFVKAAWNRLASEGWIDLSPAD